MSKEHERRETISFVEHTPDHEVRVSTKLYEETHKKLCIELDMGCFVCGRKRSELIAANLPPTETHHFVEWSQKDAINWDKFAEKIKKIPNLQTGVFYHDLFDWEEVKKNPSIYVDSVYNMIVLCKDHHTHKATGIHWSVFPLWLTQCWEIDGFNVLSVDI